MKIDRERYADCLGAFVEAAVSGETWQHPLSLVEQAFNGRAVIIMGYESFGNARLAMLEHSAGLPPHCAEIYARDFTALDVRAQLGSRLPSGTVVHDELLGESNQIARTPIYAEFYTKFDIGRFMAVRLDSGRDLSEPSGGAFSTFLTVLRDNNAETPTPEMQTCLSDLARVVQISIRATAAVSLARAESEAKSLALQQVGFGIVFVAADLAILEMNAEASSILARRDGLSSSNGRLYVHDPLAREAVERVATSAQSRSALPEMVPARRQTAKPYGLLVMPCAKSRYSQWLGRSTPRAIVFVVDSEARTPPAEVWRRLCGLTRAEAEVAKQMIDGRSQREIAENRGVSFETVKSQIKSLQQKLGAANTAEATARLIRTASIRERHHE